jgi:hypothetical protein
VDMCEDQIRRTVDAAHALMTSISRVAHYVVKRAWKLKVDILASFTALKLQSI